jgi:fluoroquinolone resistance protein
MAAPSDDALIAALGTGRTFIDQDLSRLEFEALPGDTEYQFRDCRINNARVKSDVLQGSKWQNCRFSACEFVGCNLWEAVFENCLFFDAEQSVGCIFRFCNFRAAAFRDCDLTVSTLLACEAYNAEFTRCKMWGIQFDKTDFVHEIGRNRRNMVTFDDCSLVDAMMREGDFSSAVFNASDLSNADLSKTSLRSSELTNCNLSGADLDDCDLSGADLRRSDLSGIDLTSVRNYQGLLISAGQQHHLLRSIGIDVSPDED